MNLKTHYNKLYCESIKKINDDNYEIDELIKSPLDNRFGITLLTRPSNKVKNEIQKVLNKLKSFSALNWIVIFLNFFGIALINSLINVASILNFEKPKSV